MNNPLITYKESDLDQVHKLLGAEDSRVLKARAKAVAHFMRATDKAKAVREIREMLPQLSGMSLPNLYKLEKKFDPEKPLTSLMDGRMLRKALVGGLATNADFKEYWWRLCLNNQRVTSQAYTELLERLRAGETIPGFGTWRDVYALEHEGYYPSPDTACPYGPNLLQPKGWTLRNLHRIKPDAFALVAARAGIMKAQMDLLPTVKRTRAGLKSCRVVQIDDMWYEHKVAFHGNKKAQRVVEWAMIDVATAKLFAYLPKPVIEAEEGKLSTLKTEWTRYLIAHLVHRIGIPEEGVLIMGEKGTASLENAWAEHLHQVSEGRIEFGAGGILTGSFYEGGPKGQGKGNPRYKGLLEGFHALIKNRLAGVAGQIGGGRDEHSEYTYGIQQQDDRLRKIVDALEPTRPGIRERIKFPFMDYYDFRTLIDAAYASINSRQNHALEGWAEQGFVAPFYFDVGSSTWQPVNSIYNEPASIQAAKFAAIESGALKTKRVRLSPNEAWNMRAADRSWKCSESFAALEVMGVELAVNCHCNDRLQLRYKNLSTFTDVEVNGCLIGGGTLTRGENYLVWINPFEPTLAYVATLAGKFVGCANVVEEHRYDDLEGIKRSIGIRNAAFAAEMRKTRAVRTKMAEKEAAIAAANATEILGYDPAHRAAVGAAKAHELTRTKSADLDLDWVPESGEEEAIDPNDIG